MKKKVHYKRYSTKNQDSIQEIKKLNSEGLYPERKKYFDGYYIVIRDIKTNKFVDRQKGYKFSDLSKKERNYFTTAKTIQISNYSSKYDKSKSLGDNLGNLRQLQGFKIIRIKLKTPYYTAGHKERYLSSNGFPSRGTPDEKAAIEDLKGKFNYYKIETSNIDKIEYVRIKKR